MSHSPRDDGRDDSRQGRSYPADALAALARLLALRVFRVEISPCVGVGGSARL
ncbi:MAG: hypothetical protein H7Z40_01110 [Phycisphaerae bacterium]|nr:hypothetical protein [Gemmatimonadaceae bacterium]